MVGLMLLLAVFHESLNPYLRYERDFLGVQWWRIISAHLAHSNMNHAMMNIAGFALAMLIVGAALRWWLWGLSIFLYCIFITLGLYVFSPEAQWYVGFSGCIHGLLMQGFLLFAFRRDYIFGVTAMVLVAKVINEQLPQFDAMHLADVIDAPVVVDAHLYGLVSGVVLALIFHFSPGHMNTTVATTGVSK